LSAVRRRDLLPLGLGLLATGLSSGAVSARAGDIVVPLRLLRTGDIGALPWIELELSGERTRWLVDSGSTAALVSPALAARLDLRRLSSMRVAMAGGVQTLERFELPPLPGVAAPSASAAFALDLKQLLGEAGAAVDGALGAPWLRDNITRFDFARGELRWLSRQPTPPRGAALLPVRWDSGLPVLRLSIGDRTSDEFVLDTGNAGALVVFARRAQALIDEAASLPETRVRELGGTVQVRYARLERIGVPGWVARQVPVALETGESARRGAHFDRLAGSLGVALFEPGAFTLDGPGNGLIVELPGLPEPAPLPGGFGFRLAFASSLTVSAVIDGGPAARAGLMVGDQVQSIDGSDARQWSAEQAWQALAGRDSALLQVYRDRASQRLSLRRERFFPLLR
jgi:hypothetical protein